MLEGLEISEVRLSEVKRDNFEFRIDSDFFKKEILTAIEFVNNKPHHKLKDLVSDIKSFGAYSLCNEIKFIEKKEQAIPFIRCLNIKNSLVNFDDLLFIDEKSNNLLWKSEVKPRMVLVTMSGTVGNTTVALEQWKYPINSNQDIAKIETSDINPYFLSVFLNSKYGYFQMIRLQAGAIQQHLYLSQIEKIVIPKITNDFQNKIENLVKSAHSKHEQSQSLYYQAEELLLETLDLKDFKPNEKGTNIKSLKKSFLATGRLDAEYYQPKYEKIENKIKKFKDGFSYIYKLFKPNNTNIIYSEKQYNYIEIGDINIEDGNYAFNLINVDELPANAKIMSKSGDLLVSKVRPNRGAVSIINEYIPNLAVSGAFTVLEENSNYKKEVLFVLLRTTLYKEWLLKYNVGTSYPVIKDDDVLNMPIPLIASKIQQQIAKLIKQSFSLRAESERLLDEAKTMVEREIEGKT